MRGERAKEGLCLIPGVTGVAYLQDLGVLNYHYDLVRVSFSRDYLDKQSFLGIAGGNKAVGHGIDVPFISSADLDIVSRKGYRADCLLW